MVITILGRQPHLGIAELEAVYSSEHVSRFGSGAALVETSSFDIDSLGGTIKAGKVVFEKRSILHWRQISKHIIAHYASAWKQREGKITLGISAYGFKISPRDIQQTGVILKSNLKKSGVSLRLLPNTETNISSASSHHNNLGRADNKIELIVVKNDTHVIVAESIGSQNITAYTQRDQQRPRRDAFVGMLPPKLAQIIVNLALGAQQHDKSIRVLDPFCGTGVILQEASLLGHPVYGTDLSEKMVAYSRENLLWLASKQNMRVKSQFEIADAKTHTWRSPIDVIACEGYLGQPFSAPPSPAKLAEVRDNCNHITMEFLRNIGSQIAAGTRLCVAVPAWKDSKGRFTHLPLTDKLSALGYTHIQFKNVAPRDLLYYRDDQIVARELLVLQKND